MARLLCLAGVLVAFLVMAAPASAAPPANDNFASAVVLTGTFDEAGGTNVEASKQASEPNHAGDPGGASIWYRWTAPNSGTYQVNTCLGNTDFDTLLAVYTGTAIGSLTEIASSDQSIPCSDQSVVYFRAVSGTTYHFAIDGWSDGGTAPPATGGSGIRLLQETLAPTNDNFASAQALPSQTENTVAGRNVLGTKQTGEPDHEGDSGGASIWYSWVAPVSGLMRVDVCNADFEMLFAVYTGGAVNSLTLVAYHPFDCEFTFNAVQGTTYRFAVDGFSNSGTKPPEIGDFRFATHHVQPPANDNFAAAQVISGSSTRVLGSNIDATTQGGEPAHFDGGPWGSVWYSWTAPASGQVTIDTCPSNFDTVLAVYTGNALNALTRIAGNDDACGFGASRVSFGASAGTTYRIAVDGFFDNGPVDLGLTLAQSPPPPPPGKTAPQSTTTPDKTAPQSKINNVIVDDDAGKARISFGSSEPDSSFRCKLDRKPFRSCKSPKTYRNLDEGKHKVKVQARDAAGNLDTSPAVQRFSIESS